MFVFLFFFFWRGQCTCLASFDLVCFFFLCPESSMWMCISITIWTSLSRNSSRLFVQDFTACVVEKSWWVQIAALLRPFFPAYLSNRLHSLSDFRRNNPRGMLGTREKFVNHKWEVSILPTSQVGNYEVESAFCCFYEINLSFQPIKILVISQLFYNNKARVRNHLAQCGYWFSLAWHTGKAFLCHFFDKFLIVIGVFSSGGAHADGGGMSRLWLQRTRKGEKTYLKEKRLKCSSKDTGKFF